MGHLEDEFNDEFLPDEQELRRRIGKLQRDLRRQEAENIKETKKIEKIHQARIDNQRMWYEDQISTLRVQIQTLLEKNMELGEACKVFAKGIEHLKKEGVIKIGTETWNRKGVNGSLEVRISQLAMSGKTNISIVPHRVDNHGYTVEAIIVYQYIEKYKNPIT